MNIGIDLHGTINSNPALFKEALSNLIKGGDTIVIISGPPEAQIKKELDSLNVVQNKHYHKIISLVDFLKHDRVKMWQDENGNWWCEDSIWWKSKARICSMYYIDALIDDKAQYQEHFENTQTEFFLWPFDSWPLQKITDKTI